MAVGLLDIARREDEQKLLFVLFEFFGLYQISSSISLASVILYRDWTSAERL